MQLLEYIVYSTVTIAISDLAKFSYDRTKTSRSSRGWLVVEVVFPPMPLYLLSHCQSDSRSEHVTIVSKARVICPNNEPEFAKSLFYLFTGRLGKAQTYFCHCGVDNLSIEYPTADRCIHRVPPSN